MLSGVTQRMARTAILSGALGHAGLSFWLWLDGHAPSRTWLPASWHYLVQALVVVPLYFLQWHVLSRVAARTLRAERSALHATCGWVLGCCTLGLLVAPDTVLYWRGGFEALRRGAPFVLTLLFVGSWFWLSVRLVKLRLGRSWLRTITAALLGLAAQAVVAAIMVR